MGTVYCCFFPNNDKVREFWFILSRAGYILLNRIYPDNLAEIFLCGGFHLAT